MGFGLGLGLGLTSSLGRGGVAYETEASALFTRMDVQPSAARKALINTLVSDLKQAGVWSKLDALYVTAAHDAQAARQNWVADQFHLTAVSAPTFTADRGYQGDGAVSYLNSGFNPTSATSPKMTTNSAHLGIWSRTNVENSLVPLGARTTSSTAQSLMLPRSTAGFVARINQDTSGGSTVVFANSLGMLVATRRGASEKEYYHNGASLGSTTESSTAVPNADFFVLALSTGGAASNHDTRQISVATLGAALSDQEAADYYSAVNTYLQAVGAA